VTIKLAELRSTARQLIKAVANGGIEEAAIPASVEDKWIRETCYRHHVSCVSIADFYRIRPMPEAKPATIKHEDLTS
jgi:hypothetical protein